MKKSPLSQQSRQARTGLEGAGLASLPIPLAASQPPARGTGKISPPTPFQPISERFPALEEQEVLFTFFAPEARTVFVAANFNGWRPDATPLKNLGAGEWAVRLMLRSGQYEYRFVEDGRWREDPRASQRVENPYGGLNSVLSVPLDVRTSFL